MTILQFIGRLENATAAASGTSACVVVIGMSESVLRYGLISEIEEGFE